MSIIREETTRLFYVFDSHARDIQGDIDGRGNVMLGFDEMTISCFHISPIIHCTVSLILNCHHSL